MKHTRYLSRIILVLIIILFGLLPTMADDVCTNQFVEGVLNGGFIFAFNFQTPTIVEVYDEPGGVLVFYDTLTSPSNPGETQLPIPQLFPGNHIVVTGNEGCAKDLIVHAVSVDFFSAGSTLAFGTAPQGSDFELGVAQHDPEVAIVIVHPTVSDGLWSVDLADYGVSANDITDNVTAEAIVTDADGDRSIFVAQAQFGLTNIIEIVPDAVIADELKASLVAQLEQGVQSLAQGNFGAAQGQLSAFIHLVNAQDGKKIEPEAAAFLRDAVCRMSRGSMGC